MDLQFTFTVGMGDICAVAAAAAAAAAAFAAAACAAATALAMTDVFGRLACSSLGNGKGEAAETAVFGLVIGVFPDVLPQPCTARKWAVILSFRLNFLEQTVHG